MDQYGLGKQLSPVQQLRRKMTHKIYEIPVINLGRKKSHNWPDKAPSITQKLTEELSPYMNEDILTGLLPLLSQHSSKIISVTALAALAYAAYKIYKMNQRGDLDKAKREADILIKKLLSDLRQRAPQLFDIPGWLDNIRDRLKTAFEQSDISKMINELIDTFHNVVYNQQSIGEVKGGRLNIGYLIRRRGAGAVTAIY
jgi:hypothetical protein